MATCSFKVWLIFLLNETLFRNLLCAAADPLTVDVDRISVALNTSGVTQTIDLDIWMPFDRIEYTTGLLHKITFYFGYLKMFCPTE